MSFLRNIWQYLNNWWYDKDTRIDVNIDQNPEEKISIAIGGSTKLSARVTTSSPIETLIKWHKIEDGNSMNIQTDSIKYSGSSCSQPTPELVINDVTKMDSGVYQLSVTTFTGTVTGPKFLLEVYDSDDSITREKSNFIRVYFLCQQIATESVRLYFIRKVPELALASHLSSSKKDLQQSKWKCTKDQLSVLFPAIPHNVKANQFDFTLLYKLIRNTITPIVAPTRGWGPEPIRTDITEEDDIERIHHYRNLLAHNTELKLNDSDFNYMWNDLSKTIQRLSHKALSQDVSNLFKCNLDHRQTSQSCRSIRIDLAGMKDEMNILHQEMKDYKIAIVQNQESVKKLGDLHIPSNVRQIQLTQLQTWTEEDEIYYHETKSYQATEKMVKFCSVICLVGAMGCGKTATARHLALEYEKEEGWEIVPLCKIDDIVQYGNTKLKQIFVIDDILGVFSVDMSKYNNLNSHKEGIMHALGSKSKLVCTCRKTVYNEAAILKSFVLDNIVDLESNENILQDDDKENILANHCKFRKVPENIYSNVPCTSSFLMFPLLCKIFSTHPEHHASVEKFFANPFACLLDGLDILNRHYPPQYAALILCLLSNNSLSLENVPVQMKVDAYETCGVNHGTSDMTTKDVLYILEGTYLTKKVNTFTFIHDAIYEIIAFHYGKTNPLMILKYMNSNFIATKVNVNKDQSPDLSPYLVIEEKYYEQLAKRIYTDLQSLKLFDVFMNNALRYLPFLNVFIKTLCKQPYNELKALFCHEQDMSELKHISSHNDRQNDTEEEQMRQELLKNVYKFAKKQNNPRIISWIIYYGHTNLLTTIVNLVKENIDSTDIVFGSEIIEQTRLLTLGCYSGDLDMVNTILKYVNIGCVSRTSLNKFLDVSGGKRYFVYFNQHRTLTPLTSACDSGNVSVVQILLQNKANTDQCDDFYRFPLLTASKQGHYDVVEYLVQKGCNVNHCNENKDTSLYTASYNGHYHVVKHLVQKGANINQCCTFEMSPLYKACEGGHTSIAELLVENGADVNQCSTENKSPLYKACKGGYTTIVELLVENGADVNQCSTENKSPLYKACKGGYIIVVEYLVEKGASINNVSKKNKTLLSKACEGGHAAIVEFLVEIGADVNQCGTDKKTCLYTASEEGQTAIVKFLVENGADVNKYDSHNCSPLCKASQSGHKEVVQYLLDNGADLHQCDSSNCSSLYKASEGGHKPVVEFLVEKGANVNQCDINNKSPLYIATTFRQRPDDRRHKDILYIVQYLIQNGADVNQYTKSNKSPLFEASSTGHFDVVKLLIQKGNKINQCDTNAEFPLYKASEKGHLNVVEYLIQKGANVNQCTTHADSPLKKASEGGHFNVVEYLVKQGANVNQQNADEETPLYIASTNGHLNVVEYLVQNGADVNKCNKDKVSPIYSAAHFIFPQLKIIQYLVNNGANVNQCSESNESPLYWASNRGHIKVVELLLQNGADVNKCSTDNESPLYKASEKGHYHVVEYLVETGADVNQCDKDNKSPLYKSCKEGHRAVVELLLEYRANVNQCTKSNESPLFAAATCGYVDVVELLVQKGAVVNQCNTNGESPLYKASKEGQFNVVEYLVQQGAKVNQQNADEETPLYKTSRYGHLHVVEYLVQNGAEINKCSKYNESPLCKASEEGHLHVVEYLVQNGAEVNKCSKYNESPLYKASKRGHANVVEFLVENGADLTFRDGRSMSVLEQTRQFIEQCNYFKSYAAGNQKKVMQFLKKHMRRNSI